MHNTNEIMTFWSRRLVVWRHRELALALVILISACEPFPPDTERMQDEFGDIKKAVLELDSAFVATKFQTIRLLGNDVVVASYGDGDGRGSDEEIEDTTWAENMLISGVATAEKRDSDIWYLPKKGMFAKRTEIPNVISDSLKSPLQSRDRRLYEIYYIHSMSGIPPTLECRASHAKARCGSCGIEVEDDWWVAFSWYPAEINLWDSTNADGLGEGALDAIKQCMERYVDSLDSLEAS